MVKSIIVFGYLQRIITGHKRVVITDRMWARLLSSTNQPSFTKPKNINGEREERIENQTPNGKNHTEMDEAKLGQ